MADQHDEQSNGSSPRHTRIPYTYIVLFYLSIATLTVLITRHVVRTPPSQETSSTIEIHAETWEATSAAPKALCLPPTRERLNQHFNEVYGEDFVHTEHINPTDRTKPYILCPTPLIRGKWNPKHVYVFSCQICIPSGIVMDLPYQ